MSLKNIDTTKGLVGIISYNIHSNLLNYGAALHSYAFQQYLAKHGTPSVIIDYKSQTLEGKNLKYPFFNLKRLGGGLNHHIMNYLFGAIPHIRKYNKFQGFFKKHISKTPSTYTSKELARTSSIDDIDIRTFVTESDVTWKKYRVCNFDNGFYLNFPAAEGKKKTAYAPSLSANPFTEDEERRFLELVNDFEAISTRERQGAEYLSKLLGKPVDWCLDPTLLLSRDDYDKIAVKPQEEKFVLLYNCMKNDRIMVSEAERFAAAKGLKLIEISNFYENSIKCDHTVKTDVGIEEWLGYFANADFVICNAFHGFCFSVIYSKQVILFERDNSDFRMRNITEALGADACLIEYDNKRLTDMFLNNETFIDYNTIHKRLEELRQKSAKFIQDNILL